MLLFIGADPQANLRIWQEITGLNTGEFRFAQSSDYGKTEFAKTSPRPPLNVRQRVRVRGLPLRDF
jgi:hypothetical protein